LFPNKEQLLQQGGEAVKAKLETYEYSVIGACTSSTDAVTVVYGTVVVVPISTSVVVVYMSKVSVISVLNPFVSANVITVVESPPV